MIVTKNMVQMVETLKKNIRSVLTRRLKIHTKRLKRGTSIKIRSADNGNVSEIIMIGAGAAATVEVTGRTLMMFFIIEKFTSSKSG